MVIRDEPASLAQAAPQVPALLRWVVERCLAKDPDERYASTRDLARDLQHLRDHLSEAGWRRSGKRRRRWTSSSHLGLRWPLLAATALVALLIGALLTSWLRRPAPPTITSEHYLTYSGNDFSPAVSPDGKLVAFSSRRDGSSASGSNRSRAAARLRSAKVRTIFRAFRRMARRSSMSISCPTASSSLYRIPVVGGEARRILEGATTGELSPDGKQLAFSKNAVDANGRVTSVIFLANANGTGGGSCCDRTSWRFRSRGGRRIRNRSR